MTRSKAFLAAVTLTIAARAAVAFAADAPPANQNAPTPAIADSSTHNVSAPAAGANSFTQGQAKSQIEKAGYSNVSGLMKDKDGVWRGTATKDGATTNVALDFQGNVVPK